MNNFGEGIAKSAKFLALFKIEMHPSPLPDIEVVRKHRSIYIA